MTKKITSFITCILFVIGGFAQIPSGYYNAAASKTGDILRGALRDIVTSGSVKLPYTSSSFDVWDAYSVTDTRPANNSIIWDMYSDIPGGTPAYTYTIITNQCGTSSVEGSCYSREHQVPNSWWGGLDDANNPQYTDLHHLPPADQYVNNLKSAHPIGQTSAPTWTSTNGSKVGPCSWPGYTGTVFEPIDAYKGDFARAYLYMATRYMNFLSSWRNGFPGTEAKYVIDSTGNNYKQWFIDMLVQWTINDPVSQKEIDRNNAIYYNTPQHNRNPYIDHPEYVCIVWTSTRCSSGPLIAAITQTPLYPNSLSTVSVTASVTSLTALSSVILVYGSDGISYQDTIPMNVSTGSNYITATSIPVSTAGTTIYYKIIAVDDQTNTSTSVINSYTVLKEEPSGYPSIFACGNVSASTISLTWVDASGISLPDGYLIKTSNVSLASITDPIDGLAEPDGSFTKNIAAGIQGTSFSGLSSSSLYYFKIFPYTNSGTNINYKITVTPPTTSCTTNASPGGGCSPDLLISEYVEGSASNKYIEIANYTGAAVNLANYRLRLFSNGAATASSDVLLSGTLNNQSTIVYKNTSAVIYTGTTITNAAVNYNGDDAVGLYKISTASYVDIFGRIGEDPGTAWTSGVYSTLDKTLVRNASVTSGITTNPSAGFPTLSTEWTQFNTDVVSNLGLHTINCNNCASPTSAAGNITFSSVGQTSMTINWTNGNGTNRIVVVKQGSSISGVPLTGISYTANSVFGSGNMLNTGEYIVYNNTGSSASISNLIGGQTYFFSIFEYNCVPGSEIYLTPGATASKQTYSIVTGTVPESQYCVTSSTGYSTTIDFVSTGTFSSNTFIAQLSDAAGSFASPVVIGSLVSNLNNETINCTIPANTASGAGYLIRVISNGPSVTGTSSNAFEIILSSTAQSPVSVTSDRSNFCSDDAGNITLSATGGSGTILSWFSSSCGGSFVGSGNPLTIASPSVTTTYYARWGTSCSNSGCASVTVSVSGLPVASAGTAINSCSGTAAIAMTGATATGNSNSWSGGTGMGTWTQNADPALATFTPAVSGGSFIATLTVMGMGSCPGASSTSTRIISFGTAGTWTGAVSTNWFAAGNWCGGVPVSTSNINIPPATQLLFSPTISASNARCQNIALAGSVSIANGYNLDVYGNWINNGGVLTGSAGTVTFRGTSKTISGSATMAFPGVIIGQGAIYTMNNNNSCMSLTFTQSSSTSSSLTLGGIVLSVNGNVSINNPSSNTTNAFNINTGNVTVSGNVTIGSGTSQGSRVAKIVVSSGSLTIGGNLVYSVQNVSSGIVDFSGGSGFLNIAGNITLNTAGTLSPGTSSTVNYNGSLAAQTVTFGSGITYNNLLLNNTNTAGVSLVAAVSNSNVTGHLTVQTGIFNNGGFAINGNASKQFSVTNAASFRLSGNTVMPTGFGSAILGTTSTVDFMGTLSQTIGAFNYGHLTSSNTGARILASSGTIGIAGIFTPSTNAYTISGSTLNFNGSNQAVPVFNGITGYNNLAISQVTGKATLGGNITVGGTLNLFSGYIDLGNNNLTLNGTAAISGSPFSSSKMIIADGGGELRKSFTGNASYLFPVGDKSGTSEYSPVTLHFTSGTYDPGAYAGVKLSNSKHPSNANNNNYLNRYWTISNSGISNPVYSIDAGYVAADINGSDGNISMGNYTGVLPWIKYSAANTSLKILTAASMTNTGSTSFTGISSTGPAVNIGGGGVTFCNSGSAQLSSTVIGSAPFSYSWSPVTGLSGSNIPDPVASPASTTTYTVTVTDGNGFTSTANTTITVSSSPTATISAGGPVSFCAGGSVNLTAAVATSYLWSTGESTPIITVSTSGNYSVAVTNSSGCSATSATITVTARPSSQSTSNMSICSNELPFSWNNSLYDSAGIYSVILVNAAGCDSTATLNLTVNNCSTTINLTLFIQGYYVGNKLMQPVLNNQGITVASPTQTDTIKVELHDGSTGLVTGKAVSILNTDGTCAASFPYITGLHYIVIKHRNALETWSAVPVQMGGTAFPYDFSTAANKAYADNMAEVEAGVWAIYSGDLNQDGFIDGNDFPGFDNDSFNGVAGSYQATDMNGDGFVDGNDFPVFDINSFNGLSVVHP